MNQRQFDWAKSLLFLCVIVSTILICTYIILTNINSCTSDPLGYAVEQIKSQIEVSFVYGSLTAMNEFGAKKTFPFGDTYESDTSYLNFTLPKN